MVTGKRITIRTEGFSDIQDLTDQVIDFVEQSGVSGGIVNIAAIGSTASITTIEFEPALVKDTQKKLEELFSQHQRSLHSETWGDDNGFSHMRATFMGPSITLPIVGNKPLLGRWQQIVVIDHDNRRREREIYVQVIGE